MEIASSGQALDMLSHLTAERRVLVYMWQEADKVQGVDKASLMPLVSQDFSRLQRLVEREVLIVEQARWRLHPTWEARLTDWMKPAAAAQFDILAALAEVKTNCLDLHRATEPTQVQAYFLQILGSLQRIIWQTDTGMVAASGEIPVESRTWLKHWEDLYEHSLTKFWDWHPEMDALLVMIHTRMSLWQSALTSSPPSRTPDLATHIAELNQARKQGNWLGTTNVQTVMQAAEESFWLNNRLPAVPLAVESIPSSWLARAHWVPDVAPPEPVEQISVAPSLLLPEQALLYRFGQEGAEMDLFSFLLEQPETEALAISQIEEWFLQIIQQADDSLILTGNMISVAGLRIAEVLREG